MSDFVLDNLPLPDGKVNKTAISGPAIQNLSATEWNLAMSYLASIRSHIKPMIGKIYAVSDLPGSTLSIDAPRNSTYLLILDGNPVIANPTGTIETGARLRFVFNQDGTGGRAPTWGNKFNASRFLPRQGANQSSSVEFIRKDDGTFDIVEIDGIDSKGRISVYDFGALGNAVVDDIVPLQKATDYSIYTTGQSGAPARARVWTGSGRFRTTDVLHLGYGTGFTSVVLEGDGYCYRGQMFGGSAIIPDFSDRPAVNVQGARGSVIRGITFAGKLYDYIDSHNFVKVGSNPSLDDTDPANWNDPSLAATQDSRYCPYAAVTIDAYSGSQPVTHYPTVTYPSFLGAVTQYGKNYSSDVLIEDCMFSGFTVGVANQPCDADGNGDFTNIRHCVFEYCKWGISVGNTQSRNVKIDDVKMGAMYCGLTSNQHGKQLGKFHGPIENLSFGGIKVFEFGSTAYLGPIEFKNLYFEATWKLGDVHATASGEGSIVFNKIAGSFDLQTLYRGYPTLTIGPSVGLTPIHIRFDGGVLNNFFSVCSFGPAGIEFEGDIQLNSTDRPVGSSITDAYKRYAENYLCGGIVLPRFENRRSHRIKRRGVNLDTGARLGTQVLSEDFSDVARTRCIPNFVRSIQPPSNAYRYSIPVPQMMGEAVAKNSLSSCVLSGRTLTLGFSALSDYQAHLYGKMPGDVIWDDETGSVFFITSRITTTVVAELQNNFRDTGSGVAVIDAFSTTTGNFYFANTRLYYPSYATFADLTSGSPTLASCGRADAYAGYLESDITVNDRIFTDQTVDGAFSQTASKITARDNAAKTITLDGNAQATQSRRLLPLFVRQGPANI